MTTTLALHHIDALAPTAPLSQQPAAVYLSRLGSANSRRTMAGSLREIVGMMTGGRAADPLAFPWERLRYQDTQLVRTLLAERHAPAGANVAIAALRGVLREAWRLGLMGAEDYHRAADLQGVRGERLPRGRALSAGELRALFGACAQDAGPAGARDAALLAILYGGGLRRSEATALDVADYTPDSGALVVRCGKGRKERIVYMTGGGKAALEAWLELRGGDPGALLFPVDRVGRIQRRRMTAQVCRWVLLKRARQAGVAPLPAPHDMRRTFIGDLLDAGADISTVQRLAGHSNVTTTQRYDRRGEVTKAKAAALLHIPYAGRRRRAS
jgi:site-specific recombinase XerD